MALPRWTLALFKDRPGSRLGLRLDSDQDGPRRHPPTRDGAGRNAPRSPRTLGGSGLLSGAFGSVTSSSEGPKDGGGR